MEPEKEKYLPATSTKDFYTSFQRSMKRPVKMLNIRMKPKLSEKEAKKM
jgi:hypothetical protein